MPSSLPNGWKTRLYHLSHNPVVLTKITAGILAAGFLIACGIVSVRGKTEGSTLDRLKRRFENRLTMIARDDPGQNWALAAWVAEVTVVKTAPEAKKQPFPLESPFQEQVREMTAAWRTMDLHKVVRDRVSDTVLRARFDDFLAARTTAETPEGLAARKRLEEVAPDARKAPLASQFLGELLWQEGQLVAALAAFKREGDAWPVARHARSFAFAIATEKENQAALREMLAAGYDAEASAMDLLRAGVLLGDWKLQARGYLRMESSRLRLEELAFVLLAAALWYAVFVRFGERDRWRWVRPAPAVLAGILSIWPTMVLISLRAGQEGRQENGELLHDLVFFVTGVGLREEAAKLLLFAPFVPWLLKRRAPGMALLFGAFVGLGFALDENRGYFHAAAIGATPVARLLTANFFHAAATGIAAHALYELARTRFGSADRFIATFVAVIVAHGLYDWVQTTGSSNAVLGSMNMFSIIILALLANQFFDQVTTYVQPRRGTVSLNSIFLIGTGLLLAGGFIAAAVHGGTMRAVSDVAASAINLVPIAVFYARKFARL